jgi:hypothetical protein
MECNYDYRDECLGEATVTRDNGNPYGPSTEHLCEACARWWDNREPSDWDVYNGPGMEGGIRYGNQCKPR